MFTERLCMTDKIKSLAKRIRLRLTHHSVNKNRKKTNLPVYCPIEDLCPSLPFELPVINYEKVNGRKYKYVYGLNFYKKPFSIVKINVENKEDWIEKIYDDKENDNVCLPSEPVFVPRPLDERNSNEEEEDNGILLVIVLSSNKNDFLSVLDAKDLSEIARASIPSHVKASLPFHGFFANDTKYKALNE
jgi:carotenoid cleavage dioxygenase-like enzyme